MKKMLLPLALALTVANCSLAGELGMPAAPLKISEWVKGKPVDLAALKGKQIVVVEFWATWCPPCRTSIPHLTEMQKKFKDVIFVGVTDEESATVKKFVTKMGDKMDYVVAIDDKDQTSEGYMKAFGIGGIPHAFVVDKEGRVIWQGHPMDGLDVALEQIVSGKYDLQAEKVKAKKQAEAEEKQAEAQLKLQELAKMISAGQNDEATQKLEAELVALDKEPGGLLGGMKFDPADFRKRVLFSEQVKKYQQALLDSASSNELAKLEAALTTDAPEDFDLKEFKQAMSSQVEAQAASPLLERYLEAVGENGDAAKAAELAKKVEALDLKNPQLLNQIAWVILAEDMVKQRDIPLALTFAKRAVDASQGKEAGIIDTYARALFDSGKVMEAIEQQTKAVALADDAETKAELTATLKKYQGKVTSKPSPGT